MDFFNKKNQHQKKTRGMGSVSVFFLFSNQGDAVNGRRYPRHLHGFSVTETRLGGHPNGCWKRLCCCDSKASYASALGTTSDHFHGCRWGPLSYPVWLIDEWMNACMNDWLIDWMIDWLIAWLLFLPSIRIDFCRIETSSQFVDLCLATGHAPRMGNSSKDGSPDGERRFRDNKLGFDVSHGQADVVLEAAFRAFRAILRAVRQLLLKVNSI